MKLRPIIRDYFSFTKNERIGLIILLSLIIIVLLANHFIYYFETPGKADREMFQRYLAEEISKEKQDTRRNEGKLFVFNPNLIDSLALDSLALPFKVKRNLWKYRKAGGHFYSPGDLEKVYGMNDSIFDQISKYIKIQQPKNLPKLLASNQTNPKLIKETIKDSNKEKVLARVIELNTASADELIQLKGIGPVLSKRIVKYRNLLGGFFSLNQLAEVYGLKQETIENILPYLTIDKRKINKLNINLETAEELVKHPYISWRIANSIVDFRSRNGFISEIEVLQTNKVLDEKDFQRISPYLKTND